MFSQALAPALVAGIFVKLTVAQSLGNDAPANGTDSQTGNNGNAAAENAAGASGAQSGLSQTKAIIIGVVVGLVVLVASMSDISTRRNRHLPDWDRINPRIQLTFCSVNSHRRSCVLLRQEETMGPPDGAVRGHQCLPVFGS
jgi:hypothetical protein